MMMDHLSVFFKAIETDPRISTTHIGIYASLLKLWQCAGFVNPIRLFCHEIKPVAKINSSTTYHRCVKDLHDFGYIRYVPSFKRNQGSEIYFVLKNEVENMEVNNGGDHETGFDAIQGRPDQGAAGDDTKAYRKARRTGTMG